MEGMATEEVHRGQLQSAGADAALCLLEYFGTRGKKSTSVGHPLGTSHPVLPQSFSFDLTSKPWMKTLPALPSSKRGAKAAAFQGSSGISAQHFCKRFCLLFQLIKHFHFHTASPCRTGQWVESADSGTDLAAGSIGTLFSFLQYPGGSAWFPPGISGFFVHPALSGNFVSAVC